MKDPRYTQLAKLLVSHSCQVKPGDKVLIETFDIPAEFTVELIQAVADAKGRPLVSTYQQSVLRALYQNASEDQMKTLGSIERNRMEQMQCYIGARGSNNISEMSDVPKDKMDLYERLWWKPVHSEVHRLPPQPLVKIHLVLGNIRHFRNVVAAAGADVALHLLHAISL